MSFVHVNFYSQALSKITEFYAVFPDDQPPMMVEPDLQGKQPKTLILLHGYSGNAADWVTGSPIRELAGRYNTAVIMPAGDNSFYLDTEKTGGKYSTYIGKELVDFVIKRFGLSEKREDTVIGGFSMGGYGAIHNGLAYPETFSKIIGLSSALFVEDMSKMGMDDNPIANRAYYESVFGDLEKAADTEINPKVQIQKLKEKGTPIPEMFLACGTEDFGIVNNRAFVEYLKEQNIPPTYFEDVGGHNWTFWNKTVEPFLQFIWR